MGYLDDSAKQYLADLTKEYLSPSQDGYLEGGVGYQESDYSQWNLDYNLNQSIGGNTPATFTRASPQLVRDSYGIMQIIPSGTPAFPGGWEDYIISCWGDSLTSLDYPILLRPIISNDTYDGGVAGEDSTEIKARFLAADASLKNAVVIWAGRNNFSDPTTVLADIAEMAAETSNYLVLSIINQDQALEHIGGANYDIIMGINASLAATYGTRYVDVRALLVAAYDPEIPQDVIDFGHDVPPSSLRLVGDDLHLNDAGEQIVADAIVARLGTVLLAGAATPNGILSEPERTNRVSGFYSEPGADQLGPVINSGSTSVGHVYQIASYTLVDRTLAGAANNTVGTKYTCTLAQTLTANDTDNEVGGTAEDGSFVSGLGPGAVATRISGTWVNPFPGVTISGGTDGDTVTIVDDTSGLEIGKLQEVVTSGKVYKCSAADGGTVICDVTVPSVAGAKAISVFWRGVGVAKLKQSAGNDPDAVNAPGSYRRHEYEYTQTQANVRVQCSSGVLWWAYPQCEVGPGVTSPIRVSGGAVTRAATNLSIATSDVFPASGFRPIMLQWTPAAVSVGTKQVLWSIYTDASNYLECANNGVQTYFKKRVAGVNEFVAMDHAAIAGTTYAVTTVIYPDNTLGLFIDGVSAGSGLGPELCTNVGFNANIIPYTGTNWAWQTDGSGGGWARHTAGASNSLVRAIMSTGKAFITNFSAGGITAGTIIPKLGTGSIGPTISANGSYSYADIYSGTTGLLFSPGSPTFDGYIDDVTCYQIYNNSTTIAPVIGETIEFGSMNAVDVSNGQFKNARIR